MLEEERKYEVDDDFAMPELSGALPVGGRVRTLPPVTLTATRDLPRRQGRQDPAKLVALVTAFSRVWSARAPSPTWLRRPTCPTSRPRATW